MALTAQRRFDVLKAVLAMAEEHGAITLAEAAERLELDRPTLLSVLHPVLYLSFRAQSNQEVIDTTYAFELDEDSDTLTVEEAHWLRDMRSAPPSPLTAQRLVLAAHVVKGSASKADPALDAALHKLEALTADVAVHLPEPVSLAAVRNGTAQAKTVRFRYLKPGAVEATEREVEPYKVFRKSGSWYVVCKDLGDERTKFFRIDLMADAEMTHTEFTPPGDDVDLPEELSFAHLLQHVTVEVPERLRNLLEDDYAIDEITPAEGDRSRVRLGVLGDDRLDYLLLRLGADAEWDDPSLRSRRAEIARRILGEYEP